MKFELLKSNKIKVTMNAEDCRGLGISFDAMAKNSPESREAFFKLLRRAEAEVGFTCDNARLVVEAAIQAEKSEMTLFVTKVDNEEEKKLFDKLSKINLDLLQKDLKEINDKKEENKPSVSTMIELLDFEDVIRMCHVMRECFWGSLYSYKDKYYMTMLPTYIPKASEFGAVCSESYRSIVEEHGKAIVKNSAFLFIRNKFSE
ncbi:MAG: adaptor protein MecA [Ruminococcaceae bacterium]|nr:adaptor protein MecA [Oscillospiraceae bacterium]